MLTLTFNVPAELLGDLAESLRQRYGALLDESLTQDRTVQEGLERLLKDNVSDLMSTLGVQRAQAAAAEASAASAAAVEAITTRRRTTRKQ